jgi:cob(I)alamin adenosyltransferase
MAQSKHTTIVSGRVARVIEITESRAREMIREAERRAAALDKETASEEPTPVATK